MRDGVPLPGLTPADVVSQLTHRVFGPLQRRRSLLVLDFHGLAGSAAGPAGVVAHRHHVSSRTVANNVAHVRAAGARQPLTAELIALATHPSTASDDHLGRSRIAETLNVTVPAKPDPAATNPRATPSGVAAAQTATRLLESVGPLSLDTLLAAVLRSRRFRARPSPSEQDLAAALIAAGAVADSDGRWRPPAGVSVPDRYRRIVATDDGATVSRQEMIAMLTAAGYRPSSAAGRMSSSHPLFERTGPNEYRLIR